MEYWIFQPQTDITALEIANLLSKLRRIPQLTGVVGVYDHVYDEMPKEYRRHFRVHQRDNVYIPYVLD